MRVEDGCITWNDKHKDIKFTITKFLKETNKWNIRIFKKEGCNKNIIIEDTPGKGFKMFEHVVSEAKKAIEEIIKKQSHIDRGFYARRLNFTDECRAAIELDCPALDTVGTI